MNTKKHLKDLFFTIQENELWKITGGFSIITPSDNAAIIGGSETNNCSASNCSPGCGSGPVPNGKQCGAGPA
jgi:hypothetical protein